MGGREHTFLDLEESKTLPERPPPRIHTRGRLHRVKVGETLTLPCKVENLGKLRLFIKQLVVIYSELFFFIGGMVLLWRKGVRVLTAGSIQVKRDRRIALRGTDLQITGVEIKNSLVHGRLRRHYLLKTKRKE